MPRNSDSGWSARAVAASIERSVHDGRFKGADALPPIRSLARTLKVSPATVAAAYRLLRTRGLAAGEGRRGTRVNPRPPLPTDGAPASILPKGSVDLRTGNPDPELIPSITAALRSVRAEPRLYGDPVHLSSLLAFVTAEFEAEGIDARAVTMTGGALDAIERLLREHLRLGDRVAIEDPGFPAVRDLVAAGGYVAVPFAVDDDGPVVEKFAHAIAGNCRAAIVTPRAQNPSGAAMTPARAGELAAVLREHPDLLLIENDACGPAAGVPLVTLNEGTRSRWAYVQSTSKFLGPDLRVAFIAGDSLTVRRVEGRYGLGPRWVSCILQQLVLALWSDPAGGRRLVRATEIYRQRRNALVDALEERGIEAHGASGFNVWIPVRHEGHVVHEMAERGWAVAAGEPFRIHSRPAIRVTISTLSPADSVRMADNLADVLKSGRGSYA